MNKITGSFLYHAWWALYLTAEGVSGGKPFYAFTDLRPRQQKAYEGLAEELSTTRQDLLTGPFLYSAMEQHLRRELRISRELSYEERSITERKAWSDLAAELKATTP